MVGCYLCEKGVLNARGVSDFKLVNIRFKWQEHVSTAGKIDCGVFMMLHMLFYCGELFDCDLGNLDSRNLYRAEIAATLLLSDINSCRDELLTKVVDFEKRKESLLPGLIEKRKRDDEEKARRKAEKFAADEAAAIGNDDDNCEGSPVNEHFGSPVRNSARSLSIEKTVLGSRKRGARDNKGDGMGCTIDCGAADDSGPAVSLFLRTNQVLFKDILPLKRQVLDYSFLDDHNLEFE